ncbi:MAG: insulinase family protein [Candidatus Syntrophosphaera sp.]|nr:insulinase family protein [Candidatus Syntrophosphaera sp.]
MKIKPIILSALLLCVLITALSALPPELRGLPLQQDPAILSGQLPNGLSYYIMRNPKPADIAELRLYVDVGSVNEDDDQRGLAHFTEHMAFNGTKNFAKAEVVEYLSSIGMGYQNGLNAMTGYDATFYTLKIPTNDETKLRQGLLILSDMAHQLSFDPAEIERERGVIIEEWRMGQGASTRIRDAQNAVMLAGSRYAERSPIGTHEVISGFEHDTIKRFYRDWYRPDLQSVVIVGDFEPEAMLTLVQEYFGSIPAEENPRNREDFTVPDNLEPQAVVATDREFPYNTLNVMWKQDVKRLQTLGDFRQSVIQTLFYTMLNSRLDEHSKSSEPPFSFAFGYESPVLRTMSAASVMAVFTNGKAEEALSTILTETERVQRYGFLATEFERAKIDLLRAAEKGLAEKDTRESRDMAWSIIDAIANRNVYLGPDQEFQLLSLLLEDVGLEDVNAIVTQLIPEKNMFISIGAPQQEGLNYPSEERMLEIARTVNTLEIEPYEDKALDEPIMASIPAPRPVTKESLDPQTGIRFWTLANGVKVYSKKTDFKNDEVLLAAVSPGGYSQYKKEEIAAANLVSGYVGESGFGNFDATTLDKALVGKVANASLNLSLKTEGFSGSCSPRDLELMFQLVHQYGTNPRFVPEDFRSYVQRTKNMIQNQDLDPMMVFFRRMSSERYNDHPYMKSLADFNLDEVELASVERIFRDRFADFSDFSFVIVGNFDEDLLKEYCQVYLANLPASGRREKARDVGIGTSAGQKELRFRKGSSDRSFVAHISDGKYSYSLENEVQLSALEYVLNEKLRENIREELSGVYFIQASLQSTELPKQSYSLMTVMACSPARVDELNAAIFATLDSIRTGDLPEKYAISARATLEQRHSENIRSNRYWLGQIQNNLRLGRPLTGFLDKPEYFERIDRDILVKTAKKYIRFDKNKLSVIMLPEVAED